MVESKTVGLIWFVSVMIFWIYYTFWMLVCPFIDVNLPLQKYFPDRQWGIAIPIILGLGFLVIAMTLAGLALISDSSIYKRINSEIVKQAGVDNGSSVDNQGDNQSFNFGSSNIGSPAAFPQSDSDVNLIAAVENAAISQMNQGYKFQRVQKQKKNK